MQRAPPPQSPGLVMSLCFWQQAGPDRPEQEADTVVVLCSRAGTKPTSPPGLDFSPWFLMWMVYVVKCIQPQKGPEANGEEADHEIPSPSLSDEKSADVS